MVLCTRKHRFYIIIFAAKQLKKALTYTKYGSAFFHLLFIKN